MKNSGFILLFCFSGTCFANIPVIEEYDKAMELAISYDRPVALLFTGSDWCKLSKKLNDEILYDQGFVDEIGSQFIFVKVDFPEINCKSQELLKQNQDLKTYFKVDSFPLIVLIDKSGIEITRLSYTAESGVEYANRLKEIYLNYYSLKIGYLKTDGSIDDMEKLYHRASVLQCPYYIEKTLEDGLNINVGVYFPLEKYVRLVNDGKKDSDQAKELKAKIIERDRDNLSGAHLRLALLDFQANKLSYVDSEEECQKVIEPLNLYVKSFGENDHNNLWRLHLIISEYFIKYGKTKEAIDHVEKSLIDAPDNEKRNIEKMIRSIKSNTK